MFFGFRLIHARELQATETLLARMESEMQHWQRIASDERDRADRQLDQLLQQFGAMPVTALGKREQENAKSQIDLVYKSRMAQIEEIYGEQLGILHDEEGVEIEAAQQDVN